VDDGCGQTAGGDVVVPGQAVLAVEEEDDEALAPIVRDEPSSDGGGQLGSIDAVPDGWLALSNGS
jgi:hypothetical protein